MRIDGIRIENFLSFSAFEWAPTDPGLNLIVGPNGSGKSNLVRALRMVADWFSHPNMERWDGAWHRGNDGAPLVVGLDLALTTDWERDLVRTFLSASVVDSRGAAMSQMPSMGHGATSDAGLARVAGHIQDSPSAESLEWLGQGTLELRHAAGGPWLLHVPLAPGD